jgi:hypothetical protein
MRLFAADPVPAWVLDDDAAGALMALRRFTEGAPMDRDQVLKALVLLVLDMNEAGDE